MQGFDTETLTLEFDPKVLEFRDATLGEVLGTGAGKAPVAATSSLADGVVELRLHRSAGATKDDGRLLRVTFLAKTPACRPYGCRYGQTYQGRHVAGTG